MNDCIFCKIINKDIPASIIYEDQEFLVFEDIKPIDKVHLLIIPKIHIENLMACSDTNQEMLGKMLLLGSKLADKFWGRRWARGISYAFSCLRW